MLLRRYAVVLLPRTVRLPPVGPCQRYCIALVTHQGLHFHDRRHIAAAGVFGVWSRNAGLSEQNWPMVVRLRALAVAVRAL